MADDKGRIWATIVYEESAPVDWLEKLETFSCFVSPCHDADVNSTGELKKPHYHCLFFFAGVKSRKQIKEIFSTFGGVGAELVHDGHAMSLYLCHLASPNKAQYEPNEVKSFGGLNYLDYIKNGSNKYNVIGQIIDLIEEKNYFSYAELLVYCRKENRAFFVALCDHAGIVINQYLKSRYWSRKKLDLDIDID